MAGIYDWSMELPHTVEWALHCCWLLAQTDGSPVPRRRLAEFFDLPEPYLAKLLKALVAAEVLTSVPGVNGGYRLARPADQITALDVVRGVNGHTTMFHCAEIRQRGPVGLTAGQCRQPCGIAKVMYGAELAWRNALAAATVADLIENAAGVSADRAARWLGPRARAGLIAGSGSRTSLRADLEGPDGIREPASDPVTAVPAVRLPRVPAVRLARCRRFGDAEPASSPIDAKETLACAFTRQVGAARARRRGRCRRPARRRRSTPWLSGWTARYPGWRRAGWRRA
jgi:Rrf2 family protein